MAAVPSIGRASGVERRPTAPEADATRALYERYSRQILNYCVHQLNSREEAEDAVQTTFMNAFRGLKRGIVPEAEQAWLFKIAENVCLSRRRSSWRRGKVESPNDFEVLQEIVPSKPRELSSAQPKLLATPTTCAPAIAFGCQEEMKAPDGSWYTAIRPWSATSRPRASTGCGSPRAAAPRTPAAPPPR